MSKIAYPNITYLRVSAADVTRLPRWLCAVQAVIAYEWLVSGINKLLDPGFSTHLSAMLLQNMRGNPYGWYVTALQRLVLPHATQGAQLVAWGEAVVGVVLVLGAVQWALHPDGWVTTLLALLGCPALLVGAGISLNYYLLAGNGLPWINPANAFNDGVGLNALLPLICLALLGANLSALRGRREARFQSAASAALLQNAA